MSAMKDLRGPAISSTLNRSRAQAADELFLEQKKNRYHRYGHQEGRGHGASPVHSEHGCKLGQADRQGFGVIGVRQHRCEDELVPGHQESKQSNRDDAWQRHRQNDFPQRLHASAAVDDSSLIQLNGYGREVARRHPGDQRQRSRQMSQGDPYLGVEQSESVEDLEKWDN